jgi:hypothetical protein
LGKIIVTYPHDIIPQKTIVKINPFNVEQTPYQKPDSADYIQYSKAKFFKGETTVNQLNDNFWPEINGYMYAREMLLVKGVDYT